MSVTNFIAACCYSCPGGRECSRRHRSGEESPQLLQDML